MTPVFAQRAEGPPAVGVRGYGPSLVRPRAGRKIAGVCQGFANQYGWDVTLVRVVTVLLAIFIIPFGVLAYVVFWLITPQENSIVHPITPVSSTS